MIAQIAQTAILFLIICLIPPQLTTSKDVPIWAKGIVCVGLILSTITLIGCIVVNIWT